ncbi:thioesterase family protein [soil metagenome]
MDLSFFTIAETPPTSETPPPETPESPGSAVLDPTPMACSSWSDNQMHGVALAGALARSAQAALADLGRDDLQPARMSVDLFRPAAMVPCSFDTEVVRDGPRICLIDVTMRQGGERVARAGFLFLKASTSAPGEVWSPVASERPVPPPLEVAPVSDQPRVPFVHSEAGWSQNFSEHQNASRKQTWNSAVPVVAGEPLTPFQAVAATADGASMITNWGTGGVEYINTDITMVLARPPIGVEIGLCAVDRVEVDGIAVGTAAVFDRTGQLGTVVITSIVNAKRAVDFSDTHYDLDGTRRSVRE